MAYIVDGHNLIPKIPGLTLQALDDENQLIAMLQEYCRLQRKEMEVYFDRAAPGLEGKQRFGLLTAWFVRVGTSADAAIRRRLIQLGRSAQNWTIVSSDRAIRAAARACGARSLSSDEFARMLTDTLTTPNPHKTATAEPVMTPEEVDEWLQLFETRRSKRRNNQTE